MNIPDPTFTPQGYPTEETLEVIRKWPYQDWDGLWAYVREVWRYPEYVKGEDVVEISTGGWSGNEEVISALQQNQMFWAMYWHSMTRGGHYVFKERELAG
jgi:hypothetical protein